MKNKKISGLCLSLLILILVFSIGGCGGGSGGGGGSSFGGGGGGSSVSSGNGTGNIQGYCYTLGEAGKTYEKPLATESARVPPDYIPASDVAVTCDLSSTTATTDQSGHFILSNIPAGSSCKVNFYVNNEKRKTINVKYIKPGDTTNVASDGYDIVDVPPIKKQWTYICYLASDNDLGDPDNAEPNASRYVIQSMEKVGSTSIVNAVVLLDERYSNTKMYYVLKAKDSGKIISPYEDYAQNIDTGDYNTLYSFVEKAMRLYPAEHYVLELWNHGNGPKSKEIRNPVSSSRSICSDSVTGHQISMLQLKQVLANIKSNTGNSIDIMVLSACSMGDYEVMYEVKDYVNYLIASPSPLYGSFTIPSEPYDLFLARLNSNAGNSDIASIVTGMADDTYKAHLTYMPDSPHSFIGADLTKISTFQPLFSNFANQCYIALSSNKTLINSLITQTPQLGAGGDLYTFANLIRTSMTGEISQAADSLAKNIVVGNGNLILYSASNIQGMTNLKQLCVILSSTTSPSTYDELDLAKDCKWGAFLNGI